MVADSNQVDDDHWLARMIDDPPEGWSFHVQPGGVVNVGGDWQVNPDAENLSHLPGGSKYYVRMMPGQTDEFIRVFCANERAFVIDGKAVFPEQTGQRSPVFEFLCLRAA